MAEYYPLLAKAVGSLPNSTPESRRVVYERARKALIGQLRTLHPPVPDDDIERESVALDRAVERLEAELANGVVPGAPSVTPPAPVQRSAPAQGAAPAQGRPPEPPLRPGASPPPRTPPALPPTGGAIGPAEKRSPPPVRPRPPNPPASPAATNAAGTLPSAAPSSAVPPMAPRPPAARPALKPPAPRQPANPASGVSASPSDATSPAPALPPSETGFDAASRPAGPPAVVPSAADASKRLKPPQRPIAPQPPVAGEPKRRLWIIPVCVIVVAALVAAAAWKLRDRPETLARNKPTEQTPADSGKIHERVGEPSQPPAPSESETPSTEAPKSAEEPDKAAPQAQQEPPAVNPNPAVPVAHRAALLVEAPNEPNKIKTYLGTVVWKLDNAPQGANAAVGLAVEADVDLPDDKMKATVVFEKNTDASLPASHTVKIRFNVEPGSLSGNVKQISVPQMRPEASPGGESLAGVTVPITTNSFLVGLSPGNAEAANTDLIRRLQWIDIPIMLDSGKIAKLTFEKSDSGQRDLNEAFDAWQKQ